jgi:tartrate dehydratase alpha subunit/fumarate hydratase class I-like protein
MKRRRIKEGVERGDLQSLVKKEVSIAEFEPKTGSIDEVTVIGLYVADESPAQDLASFIEKGATKVIDTEVSPNPDDTGFYIVFIEIKNNLEMMSTVFEILLDAGRLCNIEEWNLNFFTGAKVTITEKQIKEWRKKNQSK